MIVWLTDTTGPGMVAGVTDSEAKALRDAEELLTEGRASTARVEFAFMQAGGSWLSDGYRRTGNGWTASRSDDGTVRWARFSRLALAAS